MSESLNPLFSSLSELFDSSKQLAKGAELLGQLNNEEIEVGASKKTLIAEFDKVKLYRYQPLIEGKLKTDPVLIVYGLIGRYTMIDLQEDRSLVRNLLKRGVDVYVVDWGYPTRSDQFLSFDDYVAVYLDDCVDACQAHALTKSINLFGICEGGVFAAMYAALNADKISNLILTITPVDFSAHVKDEDPTHGFINLWLENLDEEDIEQMVDIHGNLPGEVMGSFFQAITPVRSLTKYNFDLSKIVDNKDKLVNFFRMEKWLADRPNHPGKAAKQWLIDLYKHNKMAKGEFIIAGETVDLSNINMPILNVYAERDHIVPPPCSLALKDLVGSDDYTELAIHGGHVGIYVSSRLQDTVGDGIFNWLIARQSK